MPKHMVAEKRSAVESTREVDRLPGCNRFKTRCQEKNISAMSRDVVTGSTCSVICIRGMTTLQAQRPL